MQEFVPSMFCKLHFSVFIQLSVLILSAVQNVGHLPVRATHQCSGGLVVCAIRAVAFIRELTAFRITAVVLHFTDSDDLEKMCLHFVSM